MGARARKGDIFPDIKNIKFYLLIDRARNGPALSKPTPHTFITSPYLVKAQFLLLSPEQVWP